MKRAFFIFVVMNISQLYELFLQHPSVSTDTRKIEKNDIFFALQGDNFNGNLYAQQAIDQGASYAIVDQEAYATSSRIILVADVLITLQELAKHHRRKSKAKIISLTGSNGKTTTKELIHAALRKKYSTIATTGNLNNHIGVPLTLLRITEKTEIAIIEMGANHQKEIEFLCTIAEPDFGYITNFGKAHLEGFGGVAGVIKGKSELYDHLRKHNKIIFFNAEDSIQQEKLSDYANTVGYSTGSGNHKIIALTNTKPFVQISVGNQLIDTQLIGQYNFTNCCAAITMGLYFDVPINDIKHGIETYTPDNNRSQVVEKKGYHIVLDAYNANPSSMQVALESFATSTTGKKLAILGDMFELGEDAAKEHEAIAALATQLNFTEVLLVGENFHQVRSSHQKFKTFNQLGLFLEKTDQYKGYHILIKGSRGMALERTLNYLR